MFSRPFNSLLKCHHGAPFTFVPSCCCCVFTELQTCPGVWWQLVMPGAPGAPRDEEEHRGGVRSCALRSKRCCYFALPPVLHPTRQVFCGVVKLIYFDLI